MKTSKGFVNPTEFFFHQSLNPPNEYRDQITEFVSKLIDLKCCVLCKSKYDITDHIPRIIIHCGHTFCTPCLRNFYRNMRVRCPLCLKLIKSIESLDRLPINHTIFSRLVEEYNMNRPKNSTEIDLKSVLYSQFTQNQDKSSSETGVAPEEVDTKKNIFSKNDGILKNNFVDDKKLDTEADLENKNEEEELSYCEFHNDRVKHFYCLKEKTLNCRVCTEYIHQKDGCAVVDLYEVEDIGEFLNQAKKYVSPTDLNIDKKVEINADDDEFVDDDDDEENEHNSAISV